MSADPKLDPRPRPWSQRDGRWLLLALLLVQLAVFFQFSPRYDYVQVARRWGVLTIQPNFSDLYFIGAAGATLRAGGDPYRLNSADPLKRPYNYTPLWLHLSSNTTVSPAVIQWLAIAMGLFSTGAFLGYLGPLERRRGLLLALLACSPPVLLAAQRGNADILMFGLVALSLILLQRGPRLAGYAGIVLATWLKIYPCITLVVLLREPRDRLRRLAPLALAACALCLVVYAGYLSQIFANTANGGLHSYGSRVIAFWLGFFLPAYGWNVDPVLLGRVCTLFAIVVALLAFRVGRKTSTPPGALLPAELDGFRAGAAVYLGTFLLGTNFDYRLLYLLLCVPLLHSLAASSAPNRRWGFAALILIVGVMWPNGLFWKPLIFVKELASWSLFFTLTVLFIRTLPRPLFARVIKAK